MDSFCGAGGRASTRARPHPATPEEHSLEADKDPNFVTALGRGLDILRCFTPERPELGTTEIARMTGLAQSTVWRLCYTLSRYGCLTAGTSPDRLRIGAGVLLLGHASIVHTGIAEAALPLLREVAEKFDASVSLAQRHRHDMVIVQRAEAQNILKMNLHIGSGLPLANSSLGFAYLAALPEERRDELSVELKKEHGAGWPRVRRDIDEALADFRKHGCVFNLGKSHADINAVGVPVVSADGRRVMALTCGATRMRMTREKLLKEVAPALKDVAAALAPLLASGRY
jgi:DNA-binding IclR family transcriptional regulator